MLFLKVEESKSPLFLFNERSSTMEEQIKEIPKAKLNDNALVSLEDAKAELNASPFVPIELKLDDPEVENYIIKLINSISSQVEMIIGRELGLREYSEAITISNNPNLLLSNFPIKKLNSMKVASGGTFKEYPLNSDLILEFNDKRSLSIGKLYIESSFVPRALLVGLGAYKYQDLKTVLINYEAGYVLPQQATEENPSDLPAAVSGIVLDVLARAFRDQVDNTRSDDMIQLTEGNVTRMWGTSVMNELAKKGYFTKAEQEILRSLGPSRAIYSV